MPISDLATTEVTTSITTERHRLAERLREAGIDTTRLVETNAGKKGSRDHTLYGTHHTGLGDTYGVMAGRGDDGGRWLVQVDVDDHEAFRTSAASDLLPDTFGVESPHTPEGETGHRYYAVTGDVIETINEATGGVENPSMEWGEIRVKNQYVIGPGSQLDGCDKDWCDECATPEGGYYRITEDRPIEAIEAEALAEVIDTNPKYPKASGGSRTTENGSSRTLAERSRDAGVEPCDPTKTTLGENPSIEYDEDGAGTILAIIHEYTGGDGELSDEASDDFHDLLSARYLHKTWTGSGYDPDPENGFEAEDGSADRSRAEFALVGQVVGMIDHRGEKDPIESVADIRAFIEMFVDRNPFTKDGHPRKWLRTDGYRTRTILNVIATYDPEKWEDWRDKDSESDERSRLTFEAVRQAVQDRAEEDSREYPSRREVVANAIMTDAKDNDAESYRDALTRLQQDREIRMACMDSSQNEYVYYPNKPEYPDPPEAEFVRCGGCDSPPGMDRKPFIGVVDREL